MMAKGSKKRGRKKFKKGILELFVEVVILFYLIPLFFDLSLFAGIAYSFAVFSIFYNKKIFKKKGVARFVVVGSILTYLAGYLLVYSIQYTNGVVFFFVLFLSIYVWIKGWRMKKLRR